MFYVLIRRDIETLLLGGKIDSYLFLLTARVMTLHMVEGSRFKCGVHINRNIPGYFNSHISFQIISINWKIKLLNLLTTNLGTWVFLL